MCGHAQRSDVEASVLDGEPLSSVSAKFSLSRQALRRHRAAHMTVIFSDGISPWETLLRMSQAADRLRDLADDAEERGRIADATRAVLGEAKALNLLLDVGVRGPQQLDYAKDAAALESAIAVLLQRVPALGDRIADELDRADRATYAAKFRAYTEKCRQLPEHQVSGNERPQELSYADH